MNGPKLCTLQKTAKTEESPSQSEPELMDITLALDLRPVESSTPEDRVKEETIQRPELSGEWARSKSYICSPCGQIFQDFLALMHHQKEAHSGVCCTNIQLEQSLDVTGLVKELGRQTMRPVSGGPTHSVTAFQCTKCHFTLQSVPELHSHILLCSNHVTASPYRKRRTKVNSISRRSHWIQIEVELQRSISSQTKHSPTYRLLRGRPKKGCIICFLIVSVIT